MPQIPKFAVGEVVGCSICVPLFEALPDSDKAQIVSIMYPDMLGTKVGSGIRYMVRYPSGFIDFLNEAVTRTPGVYPGVAPYKHQGHALKRQ